MLMLADGGGCGAAPGGCGGGDAPGSWENPEEPFAFSFSTPWIGAGGRNPLTSARPAARLSRRPGRAAPGTALLAVRGARESGGAGGYAPRSPGQALAGGGA